MDQVLNKSSVASHLCGANFDKDTIFYFVFVYLHF